LGQRGFVSPEQRTMISSATEALMECAVPAFFRNGGQSIALA
jgi:hypothetical protein